MVGSADLLSDYLAGARGAKGSATIGETLALWLAETVEDEMRLIPRGGLPQNLFRAAYRDARQRGLVEDTRSSPAAALEYARRTVCQRYPSFAPLYDRSLLGD